MSPRTSVSPGLSWYRGSSDLHSCWATKDCAKTLRNNDCVIQEPWLKKIQGLCSKYSLKPLSWEEMLTAACFPWHWTSSRCVPSPGTEHGVCRLPALQPWEEEEEHPLGSARPAVTEGWHPCVTPAWDPQGRKGGKKGTEKPRWKLGSARAVRDPRPGGDNRGCKVSSPSWAW